MGNNVHKPTVIGVLLLSLCGSLRTQAQVPSQQTDAFAIVPPNRLAHRALPWLVFDGVGVSPNPTTHQFVFDLPSRMPGPTRSIAFRRADSPWVLPITMPAFDVVVELAAGHSPVRPPDIEFWHAASRGPDFQVVTTKRLVRFPAVPFQANGDYGFTHRIPFDRPFQFKGGTSGVIEMTVTDSTLDYFALPQGTPVYFDWLATPGYPLGSYGNGYLDKFGTACGPGGINNENKIFVSAWVGAGNRSRVFGIPQMVGSGPRFFFLGLSDQTWGGLTLPFPLSNLGAPGCWILSSLDWQLPTQNPRTWTGFPTADLSVPNDPRLVGATFFLQMAHVNRAANALGVATSDAFRVRVLPTFTTEVASSDRGTVSSGFGTGWVDNLTHSGPVIMLDSRR